MRELGLPGDAFEHCNLEEYDLKQKAAMVSIAVGTGNVVITGGGGVGKTSVIHGALALNALVCSEKRRALKEAEKARCC